MKIRLTSIALVTVFCTACFPTRIITVSEPVSSTPMYSTVVTMPKTHVTTTTTQVYATEPDISLYLDLQAVAAIFAQSSTVREFESLLNNSSYIISNLDLNRDGYVDYLRVVSAMQGYNHVFVIQAVLAPNVYQDVATVVAEVPAYGNYYVEVIGSSYIYGPNYVIRPVYYTRPYIFNHICRHDYSPWKSPWYWNHYPSYYKHPAPVHVNHYHAYVNTFMKNHKYCHEVHFYNTCHYRDYHRLCTTICRNDYGKQYPERSFTVRNANLPVNNSAVQRAENATRTPGQCIRCENGIRCYQDYYHLGYQRFFNRKQFVRNQRDFGFQRYKCHERHIRQHQCNPRNIRNVWIQRNERFRKYIRVKCNQRLINNFRFKRNPWKRHQFRFIFHTGNRLDCHIRKQHQRHCHHRNLRQQHPWHCLKQRGHEVKFVHDFQPCAVVRKQQHQDKHNHVHWPAVNSPQGQFKFHRHQEHKQQFCHTQQRNKHFHK